MLVGGCADAAGAYLTPNPNPAPLHLGQGRELARKGGQGGGWGVGPRGIDQGHLPGQGTSRLSLPRRSSHWFGSPEASPHGRCISGVQVTQALGGKSPASIPALLGTFRPGLSISTIFAFP